MYILNNNKNRIQQNIGEGSTPKSYEAEAKNLNNVIEDYKRHLPSQKDFSELITNLTTSGYDLINTSDIKQKLVGIAILDCLLEVDDTIVPDRRVAIGNYMGTILNFDRTTIDASATVFRAAAASVGHLARIASTPEDTSYIDTYYIFLVSRFIKDTKSECHRFAGCLILTQLAINSSALIVAKYTQLLPSLQELMTDRVPQIREEASHALQECLHVVSQREEMAGYLRSALTSIDSGFGSTQSEKIIGSLLLLDIIIGGYVFTTKELTDMMKSQGRVATTMIVKVLDFKNNLSPDVRLKVIKIIPKLANAFAQTFVQAPNQYTGPGSSNFLSYSILFLLNVIKEKFRERGDRERPLAYISLGKLFLVTSQPLAAQLRISTLVSDIFSSIKDGFHAQYFCTQALQCLGMVINVSSSSRKFVNTDLIDSMFRGGLSLDLIENLKLVIKHVAFVRGHIQGQLLTHIKSILKSYAVQLDDGPRLGRMALARAFGAKSTVGQKPATDSLKPSPAKSFLGSTGLFSSSSSKDQLKQEQYISSSSLLTQPLNSEDQLILSLAVLSSHDFFPKQLRDRSLVSSSYVGMGEEDPIAQLLLVVKEAVVRYLDDFNADIRGAAASTCASVLDTVVLGLDPNSDEFLWVYEVINRLLMLGVGDDLKEIRQSVFASFTHSLDNAISQSENVHCLIEALSDEAIGVRAAAMTVLSRVAHYDSLHVMPMIRVTMERIMRQLQNSNDNDRSRHESVQLLQAMVRGSNTLIVPYVNQVLEPLMTLLNDPNTDIVQAALSTIGDLSVASPESVRGRLDELFPRLIGKFNDDGICRRIFILLF